MAFRRSGHTAQRFNETKETKTRKRSKTRWPAVACNAWLRALTVPKPPPPPEHPRKLGKKPFSDRAPSRKRGLVETALGRGLSGDTALGRRVTDKLSRNGLTAERSLEAT